MFVPGKKIIESTIFPCIDIALAEQTDMVSFQSQSVIFVLSNKHSGGSVYGMIHQSIRSMMLDGLGREKTALYLKEAGLSEADFVGTKCYSDAKTETLVAAAAAAFSIGVDALLKQFGHHWVRATFEGPYSDIAKFTGNNFVEFIKNLDRMHQSVSAAIAGASVPSISISEENDSMVVVRYVSTRTGLEPFVIGLLEALSLHFGLKASVEEIPAQENHLFVIKWSNQ